MTTFAPIEPETASGAAAELLTQTEKALGITPNMAKVMANSPALLRAYLAMVGALGTGVLGPGIRERLAIATAQFNGCEYCLSAHTYIGEKLAKVDAAELSAARRGTSDEPHVAALLTLSNAIVATRGHVDVSTLAAARAAGVSEAEIGEVVGHLALNVLTNYFNVLAEVKNDWPVIALA
jgi:uncharacterized peroxidase-related enzyme